MTHHTDEPPKKPHLLSKGWGPPHSPLAQWPGIEITDYSNNRYPKLNGRVLTLEDYEQARAYAIAPDGQSFVLGTDWYLRRFDRHGNALWTVPYPGTAWAVNVTGNGRLVVAAFSDGTVHWFRLSDGKELLAFFPHTDRKRWVLWTPSGYYDASPGAEDLIGWHLNRGRDHAADFYPASRFRNQFYRPDVIAKLLQTQEEGEALRLANEEAGRRIETAPVAVQTVLPPVVELLSPADGTAVSAPNVTPRYRVRAPDDAPVTALRVRVNGQAVNLPETRNLAVAAAGGALLRELSVPIPAQDSEIMLFAENKNGVSTPASVRVVWRGSVPASASKDEFVAKPKLYVLAVGVSKYQLPELQLKFAARDAQDFTAVLKKQQGALYREVEIKLLTDAAATRDEVVDGLDWLQKQVTGRDVGMLFLAGHGVNDPNGIYYFLPANADVDKLKRTGVPFSDIKNTLGSLAGKSLFFVDTCHSGDVMGGRRAAANDIGRERRGGVLLQHRPAVLARRPGLGQRRLHQGGGRGAFRPGRLQQEWAHHPQDARFLRGRTGQEPHRRQADTGQHLARGRAGLSDRGGALSARAVC